VVQAPREEWIPRDNNTPYQGSQTPRRPTFTPGRGSVDNFPNHREHGTVYDR
jgi:hypothetical protein